jgi:hypothetical protein
MQHVKKMGAAGTLGLVLLAAMVPAQAQSTLDGLQHLSTLTSTVPDNGDLNPYAIVVAPTTSGAIQKGDVLVGNFNNQSNSQGTGTTIVNYNPTTKAMKLFAKLPQDLKQCPGGVGLTTAMTMLQSGWVIVGSTPSKDGTTATKGQGCLIVLDSNGKLAAVWKGPQINGPWGNMAVIDSGDKATLFVSMSGFNVPGPDKLDPKTKDPVIVKKATVLRIEVAVPKSGPPKITKQTVIASGFGQRADKDVFLIGPTGLALIGNTLYVSDALSNSVVAIDNAPTLKKSAGTGRVVTKDDQLQRPLALAATPDGHIVAVNGLNGQAVEIDPASGKQVGTKWFDNNQAQTPPGSGDLFGIATAPHGGFYYVEDDTNMLAKAAP